MCFKTKRASTCNYTVPIMTTDSCFYTTELPEVPWKLLALTFSRKICIQEMFMFCYKRFLIIKSHYLIDNNNFVRSYQTLKVINGLITRLILDFLSTENLVYSRPKLLAVGCMNSWACWPVGYVKVS